MGTYRYSFGVLRGLTVVLCASLVACASVDAGAVDRKRMNRDLDIMEAVLARLLQENGATHSSVDNAGVRGIYFDGYGALFLVDRTGLSGEGTHRVRVIARRGHGAVSYRVVDPDSIEAEGSAPDESILGKYRDSLIEFLGTYADAIGQLEPTDRVTVLINPGNGGTHDFSFGGDLPDVGALLKGIEISRDSIQVRIQATLDSALAGISEVTGVRKTDRNVKQERQEAEEAQLEMAEARREMARARREIERTRREAKRAGRAARAVVLASKSGAQAQPDIVVAATVRRSDIEAFNKGNISEKAFSDRIAFRERKQEDLMSKKVSILAEILDRTVEQEDRWLPLKETRTTGIYQEGLGVIYFVRPQSRYFRFLRTATADEKNAEGVEEKLVKDITEAMADYGHTLRLLKPDESIICQVDLSARSHGGRARRLTLRAHKKAIDNYRKGNLDLDGFRKKVEILE